MRFPALKSPKGILLVLFGLILIWLVVRFVVGGPEDAWICEGDQWVRHGSPSAPMPKEGCNQPKEEVSPADIANPASVFCEEKGGTLRIVTDASGGQYGICRLAGGVECEEWAYFRGECQ